MVKLYSQAGFTIQDILTDWEFEKVKFQLLTLLIHVSAKNTCCWGRALYLHCTSMLLGHSCFLPFTSITNPLIICEHQFETLWLKAFPIKAGIPHMQSPLELIRHHEYDALKSDISDITNEMLPQVHLGLTWNIQKILDGIGLNYQCLNHLLNKWNRLQRKSGMILHLFSS